MRTPQPPLAGAILTSGIYELGQHGVDLEGLLRRGRGAVSAAFLADATDPGAAAHAGHLAELDPPDFIPDTEKLIAGRKAAGKPLVSFRLPNHSHLSEAYAVGTADESLTGPVLKFIEAPPK